MNNEKQTHARELYFQTDFPVTQIADMLGIPRRTLHHWIKEQNWARQKQCSAHMPVVLTENCYHIIGRLQDHILSDERINTPITHREADTLHKLIITIGKMKTRAAANESMETMGHFMDHVASRAPEVAQAIVPFVEDYIASRAAEGAKPVSVQYPTHVPAEAPKPAPAQQPASDLSPEEQQQAQQHLAELMAWAAEYEASAGIPSSASSAHSHPVPDVHIPDADYAARRESPPDYKSLIAHLLHHDKQLNHLYPVNTRPADRKAA